MPARALRLLAVAIAFLLVAGVAAAATHDDDSLDVAQRDSTTTTTETSTADPDTEPSATPETRESPDSDATPAETTTTPPSSAPAPTDAPATTQPAAPDPDAPGTTPGTYVYDTTGTVNGEDVSGTSTLEVAPVAADGRQTHVQSAPDGKTTTVYRHAPEGTYLESLEIESDQGSFRLEATAPYLLLPADAGPGTKTSGTLQGEDLTADVEFTVVEVGAETSTATLHVDLAGEVQGFEIDGTMDSTILARTSDQLAVEIDAESDIEVGGGVFRIRSDTRSVLRR